MFFALACSLTVTSAGCLSLDWYLAATLAAFGAGWFACTWRVEVEIVQADKQ